MYGPEIIVSDAAYRQVRDRFYYLTRLTLQANPPGPAWHPVTHLDSKEMRSSQWSTEGDQKADIIA